MFRALIFLAALSSLALTLGGFLGSQHPAFDTMAAFRLHGVIALAVLWPLSLATRMRMTARMVFFGALIGGIGLAPTLAPARQIDRPDIVAYQHNLRFNNATPDAVIAQIRDLNPDIITLQEVSQSNMVIIEALGAQYPGQIICPFAGIGGVAVLTRLPLMAEPGCAQGKGLAWLEVQTSDGTITILSTHLPWPWPYEQDRQVEVLAELAAQIPGRILLMGDFNAATWSHAVRRLARASRTHVIRGLRLTFHRPTFWPGLAIDQVLVADGLETEVHRLPKAGSDHNALAARIQFN